MGKSLRILIADNDVEFAKGIREYISKQSGLKVVEIVRDGRGAVSVYKIILPDLILMDLRLPVLDSIKTIQTLMDYDERVKILVTSSIPNDRYALEAIKAGAAGYVEKNGEGSYETIVEAIHQVAAGESLLNPALASSILEEFERLVE